MIQEWRLEIVRMSQLQQCRDSKGFLIGLLIARNIPFILLWVMGDNLGRKYLEKDGMISYGSLVLLNFGVPSIHWKRSDG